MHTDSSQSAPQEEKTEPCPTPLVWQEVVRTFDAQQTQLDFRTTGGHLKLTSFGSGQPLLFFPGHVATPRLFALIAWLLKDQYRCLLVQHPFWNKTPSANKVIQLTAKMLSEFLVSGIPEGVDVFGSGFGGQVALQLALDSPELVRKSVLQSAWAHRDMNLIEQTTLRFGTCLPSSLGRVPLWSAAQVQNHRLWFPPFDETRFGFLLEETRQCRTRNVARRLLAACKTNLTPQLANITHPVHVLTCEGDGPLLEKLQQRLKDSLPNVTSEEMHTTGQYPYLTHPHRIAKLIRREFPIRETCPTPLF